MRCRLTPVEADQRQHRAHAEEPVPPSAGCETYRRFGRRGLAVRTTPLVTIAKMDGVAADCFICRKHASGDALAVGIVYEDDLVFASHVVPSDGAADAYLGYAFAETKRHVAGLGELTDAEASAVGSLVNDVAAALCLSEGAEHVDAHVYGDGVPHLHVHLQARYPETPLEYWPHRTVDGAIAVSLTNWPSAARGDLAAVRALTNRLAAVVQQRRATDGP